MDRRLAAILAADVVNFSALVGGDEDGALGALKGHLSAIEPVIGLNGGRIVKSTGDGFLAEFSSVVAAVSCSVSMQRHMAERDHAQAEPLRMQFRMAVHVGDVVVDGEDILGDGVNVAARLQEVAPPGGVVVSRRVHEDVADKMDLGFTDLGEHRLKNIARPMRAFAVDIGAGARAAPPAPERPNKPSVAVLAFDNLSSDAEQDYFADGITEDIITGLSHVPWLFVIARNSSFSYKGLAVDVRRIGRELGVRYVLEGSVRKSGQRLRVTGQLIDAETGAHLWADRFDGLLEDVFDLQDRITVAVIGAIAPEIRQAEIERANRKRPESLDAYDHFLRALAAVNRFRMGEADGSLAEAIRLAPDYPIAAGMRAWLRTLVWHPSFRPGEGTSSSALRLAERVLTAPDADIEAAAYAGYVLAFYGDAFDEGLSHVRRAVELCPNCVSAWGSSCLLNAFRGNTEGAIADGEQALRLNPRDPLAYRVHMGMALAYLAARDFERLLGCIDAARTFQGTVPVFRLYEVAGLALGGEIERARDLAAKYRALFPAFGIGRLREQRRAIRAVRTGLHDPLYEGLSAAGIPE